MNVWHYAPWSRLGAIVASGHLRPSNAGGKVDEVPLLWFSANQEWEPTATKMVDLPNGRLYQMSFAEQQEVSGCIRFGLPADDLRLIAWKRACSVADIGREERRGLERAGRKRGADPKHWFATVASVDVGELAFMVLLRGSWYPAIPSEMVGVWEQHTAQRQQSRDSTSSVVVSEPPVVPT